MSMLPAIVVTPVNPRKPLREGEVLPVSLEQTINDHTGHPRAGPHPVGKATVLRDGKLSITLIATLAGRDAAALLADDVLDAVLFEGKVRLR